MTTSKVTDSSFEADVIDAGKPVLVDFWAEWCGPCKQIGPALEELAGDLGDRLTIAKINIDENPNVPTKYGVRGIPTLMLFKDGQVAATKVGALPKNKIKEWIESEI
ncbi:MAG: thioredoxin TrxA [Alphaproteobacteria bacterium]|nr:thiol reductase thioredoxin [Rhodobiaceae bacterium]MBO6544058.1 thioredoxin TrxA [Alphaproteobacteria bacterium]MBO6629218.1 thioredoxin TrxA [Alphaproteobacteria bacterium]MDF1627850.1 thioredoxin TrxA [Parvibaculaceae bacterium]|tara:strand:+ start:117 stop:437 length:321 start_codon:yes stop_codon:yes gene_type:complete